MDDLCTGCLSTGRKLHFIGETGFYQLYTQILNEIPVYDLSVVCVRVCWECRGRLRSMQLFKEQVKRNYADLMQNIPGYGCSRLSTQIQHVVSWPEVVVKRECADSLTNQLTDSLTEEHCEPETFADSLSIQPEENYIKPLKKKKKPKIKLKKTSKVKKKRKKKTDSEKNIENGTDNDVEHYEESPDNNEEIQDNNEEGDVKESGLQESDVKESVLEEINKKEEIVESELTLAQIKANGIKATKASAGKTQTESGARPQCQECGKVFSSKKTYRYHLNVLHKGQNQYPCPRCGKVYQWKSNLGRHMRSHRAVDDGELYCALCVRSFASVATYRQHLRISRRHVPEAEFTFSCEQCGKRFVNKTRLRDHVDWEHLHRVKFRCKLCEKPFKCHTSLYVHTQNVHVGRERKDNLCHVCGKSYQNAAKLKYHITAMHSGETPYRCAECGAAFGWYSSLYRHTREVHYKMKGVNKKSKKPPAAQAQVTQL